MGFFDWLFGEDDPDPVTSTITSVERSEVPEYITQPHERAITAAEELATTPYQPFPGPRVAGVSEDTLAGSQGIRERQGIGVGQIYPAYSTTMGTTGAITEAERNQYMNPYLSAVGGQTEREMLRGHQQQQVATEAAATRAGAYGGARHGVVESEANRNYSRNVGDMWERVHATGFDAAQKAAQGTRTISQRGAATAGQLAGQGQNMAYQDLQSRMGVGQLQEQRAQQNLDIGYQDYLRQQDYPWQQLSNLGGVLSGAPYSTTLTSNQTNVSPGQPTTGFFQQAAGLGISAIGQGFGANQFASLLRGQ